MTQYHKFGLNYSQGQLDKLIKAYKNNEAVTIRLTNQNLDLLIKFQRAGVTSLHQIQDLLLVVQTWLDKQ